MNETKTHRITFLSGDYYFMNATRFEVEPHLISFWLENDKTKYYHRLGSVPILTVKTIEVIGFTDEVAEIVYSCPAKEGA